MISRKQAGTKSPAANSVHVASLAHTDATATSKKRKSSTQPKFYAVRVGRIPGVYLTYKECERNIIGFKNAIFKSFADRADAEAFAAGREPSTISNPSSVQIQKFYGVASGRNPGVYTDWAEAQKQIVGWKGPRYKKFSTREEAELFVQSGGGVKSTPVPAKRGRNMSSEGATDDSSEDEFANRHDSKRSKFFLSPKENPPRRIDMAKAKVQDSKLKSSTVLDTLIPENPGVLRVYTDGSSLGNGKNDARAGLGVYFGPGDPRNLSERLNGPTQTNQRAELSAILRALELMPTNQDIQVVTDSKYSIDCVTIWYKNWERNNWQTSMKQDVLNKDLIQGVLAKIKERGALGSSTRFSWVKGHSKEPGNEAADHLAVLGAQKPRVE